MKIGSKVKFTINFGYKEFDGTHLPDGTYTGVYLGNNEVFINDFYVGPFGIPRAYIPEEYLEEL